jgi:hypothetical protein
MQWSRLGLSDAKTGPEPRDLSELEFTHVSNIGLAGVRSAGEAFHLCGSLEGGNGNSTEQVYA